MPTVLQDTLGEEFLGLSNENAVLVITCLMWALCSVVSLVVGVAAQKVYRRNLFIGVPYVLIALACAAMTVFG